MTGVLVTGITSYLGLNLAAELARQGHQVHGLVRPSSDRSRVQALIGLTDLHTFDGDMGNLLAIMDTVKPDTVIHLATRYLRDHIPAQVAELVDTNVKFGAQLLEAAARAGTTSFINAGSFFQYFDVPEARALNLYAATKLAFEEVVAYFRDARGIRATTLILYDVYGPGDWRPKLMHAIRGAAETGKPIPLPAEPPGVDMVYIDDAVAAFVQACRLMTTAPEKVDGKTFAVSSGQVHALTDIVAAYEAASGRKIPVDLGTYPTPARTISAPWRGPALPGWTAEVSLAEGIRRIVAEA
ncbi:MAG: NAD(P)-dependent oxidoreductase [Rhodospirillaceae bacterium]